MRLCWFESVFLCGLVRSARFAGGCPVARQQLLGAALRASMPGLAPAGESLFFASPKKSNQKKGDPQSGSLRWRFGQLAVLEGSGIFRN